MELLDCLQMCLYKNSMQIVNFFFSFFWFIFIELIPQTRINWDKASQHYKVFALNSDHCFPEE